MKLDYCVLGTNNMDAAVSFYNALFDGTGLSQVLATDRMTFWQGPDFAFAVATWMLREWSATAFPVGLLLSLLILEP